MIQVAHRIYTLFFITALCATALGIAGTRPTQPLPSSTIVDFETMSNVIEGESPTELIQLLRLARTRNIDISTIHDTAHGMNILMDALGKGKKIAVNILLHREHRRNLLQHRDIQNRTALMYAMYAPDHIAYDCTHMLITAAHKNTIAININDIDTQSNSALTHAVQKNNTKTALFLIAQGANVLQQDIQGRTPLLIALERQNTGLAACMLKAVPQDKVTLLVNVPNNRGKTPLMEAAAQGYIPLIHHLHTIGARLTDTDQNQHDLVDYALRSNTWNTVAELQRTYQLIKKNGHNYLARTLHDLPLFTTSVQYKDTLKRLALLIKHGASPATSTIYGKSPIQYAQDTQDQAIIDIVKPRTLHRSLFRSRL